MKKRVIFDLQPLRRAAEHAKPKLNPLSSASEHAKFERKSYSSRFDALTLGSLSL